MKSTLLVFLILSFFALVFESPPAWSSSGNPPLKLAWKKKGEVLTYRSCGCADSCWSAELRKAEKLIVRLQCDCEKLHVSRDDSKPMAEAEIYRETCQGFDGNDKLDRITQEIERLQTAGGI